MEEKKKIKNIEKLREETFNQQNLNSQISLEPPGIRAGWNLGDEAEEILGVKSFQLGNKDQLAFLVKWQHLLIST